MLILFSLLAHAFSQATCPSLFYVAPIKGTIQQLGYSYDYNYVAAAIPNKVIIIQADTGTYNDILTTDIATHTALAIDQTWLAVGGLNNIMVWGLDQVNHIVGQMQVSGSVTYIQIINSVISLGTDRSQGFIWDPIANSYLGRSFSNVIQTSYVFYQVFRQKNTNQQNVYDSIYIGLDAGGTTQLQYYTDNINDLLLQTTMTPGNGYQVFGSTSISGTAIITTSFIYFFSGQLLYKTQIVNNNGVATITNSPSLNVGFTISSLNLQTNYLSIFGVSCEYQTYVFSSSSLGTQTTWTTSCPNVQFSSYQPQIKLLVANILNAPLYTQSLLIYQFDGASAGTQVRSFYYVAESIQAQIITTTGYIIQGGQSTGNLYIYNQWFQPQILLSTSVSAPIQIVDSTPIVVLYANGNLVSVISASTTCQYSGYSCYNFAIQDTHVSTYSGTINSQYISVIQYNSATYVLQAINNEIFIFTYQSNQFVAQALTYTMASPVQQIYSTNTQVFILMANNQLVEYPIAFLTTNQAQTASYSLAGNQGTFSSQYLFVTNTQAIYIYSLASFAQVATVQLQGMGFAQLLAYQSDQLLVLEANKYYVGVCNVNQLLQGQYSPYQGIEFVLPGQQLYLSGNFLLTSMQEISFLQIMPTTYYTGTRVSTCSFSQSFSGTTNFVYVSTQLSFRQVQVLYVTIQYLQTIQITIQIQSQVLWNQIVINQQANQNVQLTIVQQSGLTSTPSLIFDQQTIRNFKSITISNIILSLNPCILYLIKTQTVVFTSVSFVSYQNSNQMCPYLSLIDVNTFTLTSLQINNLQFASSFLSVTNELLSTQSIVNLNQVSITNCQVQKLVFATTVVTLNLNTFTLSGSSCITPLPAAGLESLIQYSSLSLSNFQLLNNNLCAVVFNNFVKENFINTITLNQVVLQNNRFSNTQFGFLLNCLTSNGDLTQSSSVTITNLQSSGNSLATTPGSTTVIASFYAVFLFRVKDVTVSNSQLTDSGFMQMNCYSVTYTTVSFVGTQGTGISVLDTPTTTLTSVNVFNAQATNQAIISISNSLQQSSSITLTNLWFNNTRIISTSLAQNSYGIYLSSKGVTTVNIQNLNMSYLNLQAAEQNFIITSTGIFATGFQTTLTLSNSQFYNNSQSITTSLFVLNVYTFNMAGCQIDGVFSPNAQKNGFASESGGVGQIAAQFITVGQSYFNNILSSNGAVFYMQPFSSSTTNSFAILQFTYLTVKNVYSLGSAAFYVDDSLRNTNITFQNCNFQNIYALDPGAVLYMQETLDITVQGLKLTEVNQTTIKEVKPYAEINRAIQFLSCTFANLFSGNGVIVTAQYYIIIMQNSNFQYNKIQDSNFSLANYKSGCLFNIRYSQLMVSSTSFSNFSSSDLTDFSSSLLIANASWISFQSVNVEQARFRETPAITLTYSYFTSSDSYFYNSTIIGTRDITKQQIGFMSFINSTVYIFNIQITFCQCTLPQCSAGAIAIYDSIVNIQSSLLWYNRGQNGGAISINLKQPKLWVSIQYSNFTQNIANIMGGAISALIANTTTFNVSASYFNYNNASHSGGAIFTNSSLTNLNISEVIDIPHIYYLNLTFRYNYAAKYGGALKVQTYYPYQQDILFQSNAAGIEGQQMSSYPTGLYLCQPLNNLSENIFVYQQNLSHAPGYSFITSGPGLYQIWNFPSGGLLNQSLVFIFKGTNNETMYVEQSQVNISNNNETYQLQSQGNTLVNYQDGQFNLTQVKIIGQPDSATMFTLYTEDVKSNSQLQYYYTSSYSYPLVISFRACLIGETIQTYGNATICYLCLPKFYSFIMPTMSNTGQCLTCPANLQRELLCEGGARTIVSLDYWRENVTTLDIIQCTARISYCAGGSGSSNDLCGPGYLGPLCQECNYELGYARDIHDKCVMCESQEWPIMQIVATSAGVFAYLALSIYFVAQDVVILCIIPCINQLLPPNKRIGSNLNQVKDLNSLMKIFLAYFQITSIIRYVTQDLPIWVEQVSDPNILSFSLECPLLPFSNTYGIPMIYLTYLIQVSVPIMCLMAFFLIYAIIFRTNKVYRNLYVASTWLVLWLFFLPNFYKKTLYLLNCKQIGSMSYLQADLNQGCYQKQHFFYALFVAVPCLLFFVFYIPLMILYKIHRDLHGEEEKRPLRRYRYYYINGEFKEKYFFWEFVRLAEKLLIQTAIEVFQGEVIYMSESCLIIVLTYGVYSFYAWPYGEDHQNFVNVVASFASFTTVYLALVIATIQTGEAQLTSPTIYFFQFLMAAVNVLFIAWILWKITVVLLPVLFVNIEEIQKQIADISFLRGFLLKRAQRTRLLFQRLGQKIIVINIIKKKTKRKLLKQEIKQKLIAMGEEERLGTRRRQRTAAQDALDYILRLDNPELSDTQDLTGWTRKDSEQHLEEEYIELPEFTKR